MATGTPGRRRASSARRTQPELGAFEVIDDTLVSNDVRISFQRTLRVGESGLNALPPSLGSFPLRTVDPSRMSPEVAERGGVLLPLYVREAMWINFDSAEPVAVQIGVGGRCAVSGRPMKDRLTRRPQNYVVLPDQPWLDGFKTGDGEIRQFVGVPPGSGLSVEHQLTGQDSVGGIQIQIWRLTPEALERWRGSGDLFAQVLDCMMPEDPLSAMAVGAGGRIAQEVYRDDFAREDWQSAPSARCWVHLVSAASWRALTGEVPPPTPIDTEAYIAAGLPWFDFYDADKADLPTTSELAGIASVGELLGETDDTPVLHPGAANVVRYGDRRPAIVPVGRWL